VPGRERDVLAVHAGLEHAALRWLPGALSLPEDRALPGLGAGLAMGRAGRWEVVVEGFYLEATSRSEGPVARGRQVERAQGAALSPRLVLGGRGGWGLGPRLGYVEVEVERDQDPLAPRMRSYLRTAEVVVARDLLAGRFGSLRMTAGAGVALGTAHTRSPRVQHDWSGPLLRLGLHAGLGRSALQSAAEP
jgi:hypothetical protein